MPWEANDEREQTLEPFPAEMDGFDTNKGLLLLAATNRPELDPGVRGVLDIVMI